VDAQLLFERDLTAASFRVRLAHGVTSFLLSLRFALNEAVVAAPAVQAFG
jgi:hypothetical protein